MKVASVQDTSRSAAHQSSVGGGFSASMGGASANVSMQKGRGSGNYAGVNEQSGLHAGDGGFDITVRGNTGLKGAYIASDAAPDKNRLTTGTLSYSDILNHSEYAASSFGISAGGGVGNGGNNYATHGQTSGKNTGGALPVFVSESGSSEALTRSAVSAGRIVITDQANQKQDVAMLNRDTSHLNGTVGKTPDLQNVLGKQSDLINAAQAAAETVAKQIGAYADKKAKAAHEAAANETDLAVKAEYLQKAKDWSEGGDNRTAMHVAGGALTGGLTGGGLGAVGGALGAGLSAKLAPELSEVARSIKEAGPTGNADVDTLLGNLAANVLAGGMGAVVGGGSGAMTGAAVERFNRQLPHEEKILAKQLAEKSGGKYTQAQIEDQMRGMGVSTVATGPESGAPDTLVGQTPADSGAKWIYAGTTADGKPILTQVTAQANAELQQYIIANANTATDGQVPSQFTYDRPSSNGWGFNVSGPFTRFDQSDANYVRNTTADAAAMVSANAGRFGAVTAAAAALPSPHAPGLAAAAFGATIVSMGADAVGQLVQPNVGQYWVQSGIGIAANAASEKFPFMNPAINEVANKVNNSGLANKMQGAINVYWKNIIGGVGGDRNEKN